MLEELQSVRGVSYTWRQSEYPEKDFDSNVHYGFIAQELEETFPDLVGTDANGWKAVRYNGMIPILVESLKQAASEIQDNKLRIKALENSIAVQDRRLEGETFTSYTNSQNYIIITLLVTLVLLKLVEIYKMSNQKKQSHTQDNNITVTNNLNNP